MVGRLSRAAWTRSGNLRLECVSHFPGASDRRDDGVWHRMMSVFVFVRRLGADVWTAYLAQGVTGLIAALLVARSWWIDVPAGTRYALLVLGTFFATPYLQDYDFVVTAFVAVWLVSLYPEGRVPGDRVDNYRPAVRRAAVRVGFEGYRCGVGAAVCTSDIRPCGGEEFRARRLIRPAPCVVAKRRSQTALRSDTCRACRCPGPATPPDCSARSARHKSRARCCECRSPW